jgi:hypothetical protein
MLHSLTEPGHPVTDRSAAMMAVRQCCGSTVSLQAYHVICSNHNRIFREPVPCEAPRLASLTHEVIFSRRDRWRTSGHDRRTACLDIPVLAWLNSRQ